ncbi:sodium/potassium-transporting ATPase subunit beta-1-interacting protein isoform X2 [Drosophila eugracilis]|uniref:sodium/potassium-transporting ATPase subunit beta-1-interacting protein isoform X2 n=1 Tax=Drosophila eugracilis TaxID=29029 RepID=UPI0007E87276|nr:sodium/potassium-transporting ATPase subunit beta-1-interacting protein isoform X2 [Drosophila eugracilis]
MGSCSCTRRHFLLSICFLQVITIIERQVFDFLGYMWAPILVNFFHILFIIFGFYGAYHFRVKYIITYLIWNFLWIGWNAFLICFYLNVGQLNRDSDLLNLGTGSVSWFEANGYGCKPTYNMTADDPFRPQRPERVEGCLLDYPLVEITHSGVQCALALLGILGAILISCIFLDEDDRLKHISKQSKHRQSLYSIEFGSSTDTIRHGGHSMGLGMGDPRGDQDGGELSPKPMTPRRVKRRSVMARGTQGRQSSGGGSSTRRSHHSSSGTLRSKHGHGGHGGGADSSSGSYVRSSTRNSRRKYHQNPVTKIIDQQLQQQQQHPHLGSFHRQDKLSLTASNLHSLNNDIVTNTNASSSQLDSLGKSNRHFYHSFRKNIPLDPIYYNTNGLGVLEDPGSPTLPPPPPLPSATASCTLQASGGGHYNPSYQHSTTQLNDVSHPPDELYNNRPPSVRSSYSNFHGSRPLSSAYVNAAGENVFAGLNGASASPPQAPCTPPLYQQHPMHLQQQHQQQHYLPPPPMDPAPAYVSAMSFSKRTASRESIRSMAFLNNGPPAYNLNYHTPPDSETTM